MVGGAGVASSWGGIPETGSPHSDDDRFYYEFTNLILEDLRHVQVGRTDGESSDSSQEYSFHGGTAA